MANIKNYAFGIVGGVGGALAAVGRTIKHRRLISVVVAGLMLLAVAGAGLYLWLPRGGNSSAADPEQQTDEEIKEYAASEGFGRLSVEQRDKYIKEVVESRANPDDNAEQDGGPGRAVRRLFRGIGELTEKQREQLHKNLAPIMRRRFEQRLDEYFTLSPREKQEKLDEFIDRMQQWRSRRTSQEHLQSSDGDAKTKHRRRPGGPSTERMKRMIESTPPEFRAKVTEFIKDLHNRMEERGIEPPEPPGRGRR